MLHNFSLFIALTSFFFSIAFGMEPEISCASLYTTMETFLRHYKQKDSSKTTIIFLEQCLKSITYNDTILDELIIYAYTQRSKNSYHIQLSLSKKYIIVYCMRLKGYFNTLQSNNLSTPTHKQFKHHLENINSNNTIYRKIQQAHIIGINLSIENASSDLPFHVIPDTIALEEFKILLSDTKTILYQTPAELRIIEQAVYKKVKNQRDNLNNL